MRTTVRLDPEVLAAAKQVQQERGVGLGEAVNELARGGMARKVRRVPFVQRTVTVGLTADITNIGDVLELLDEADASDQA